MTAGRAGGGRSNKRTRIPSKAATPNRGRLLAPIALVVAVVVCFAVLAGQGDDTGPSAVPATVKKSTTVTKAEGASGAVVTTRTTYKVKAGDSFAAIAENLGIDVNTLQDLNPEIDPRALQPGQKLKLR